MHAFTADAMVAAPSEPDRQLPVDATSAPNPLDPTARASHSSKKSSSAGAMTLLTKYERQSVLDNPHALSRAFLVSVTTVCATYGALTSSPSPRALVQCFDSRQIFAARDVACSRSASSQASACAWSQTRASMSLGVDSGSW